MPYASNDSLPPAIKDNLPSNAQDIWRNAFNSAFRQYDGDEEKSNKIAWGAVKNAGFEKDEQGNWKKIHYELKDVEIFSIGNHKGEEYNETDLDELIINFNELKDKIKPPLKIAHRNQMHRRDGQPSLGWATELKKKGGKLLASFSDVPRLVKEALSKKLYKRVSSELYNNLVINGKKYKRVLAGVGLLGADIPEVKNLADIEIFFGDSNEITTHEFDVENGIITYTEENIMDTKDIEALFQKKIDLMQAEFDKFKLDSQAKLDAQAQKFTEEKAEFENKIAEKEKTAKVEELKTFCEKMVSEGVLSPAERDEIIKDIDKVEFSEGNELSIPFANFKASVEKRKAILDKTEHGFHLSADQREKKPVKKVYSEQYNAKLHDAELDEKAREYARVNKVDYTEAMVAVMEANPELAEAFSETGLRVREDK